MAQVSHNQEGKFERFENKSIPQMLKGERLFEIAQSIHSTESIGRAIMQRRAEAQATVVEQQPEPYYYQTGTHEAQPAEDQNVGDIRAQIDRAHANPVAAQPVVEPAPQQNAVPQPVNDAVVQAQQRLDEVFVKLRNNN